jgi:hypothetical protein
MFPLVDMGANQASRLSFLSRKERGGDIQDGPVAEIIILSHELSFLVTLCPVFYNGRCALSHSD